VKHQNQSSPQEAKIMISKLIGKTIIAGAIIGGIILAPDVFGQANRGKGIRIFSGPKNQASSMHRGLKANMGHGFGLIKDATGPCFIDADGDGVCDMRSAHAGMMGHGGMGMGMGMGRGFVDANNDGINDNSPLAQLNLTDEQKQKIIALRESGPGPHFEALKSILTEEQLAQLETLRAQRQAERQTNCPGMGMRQGRGGRGMGCGGGR